MDKYWDYVKGDVKHDKKTGYATNRMPLWVKPNHKITLHEMMNFMLRIPKKPLLILPTIRLMQASIKKAPKRSFFYLSVSKF